MILFSELWEEVDQEAQTKHQGLSIKDAFEKEIKFYMRHITLDQGVAETQSLQENVVSMILSMITQTPLIVIGEVFLNIYFYDCRLNIEF